MQTTTNSKALNVPRKKDSSNKPIYSETLLPLSIILPGRFEGIWTNDLTDQDLLLLSIFMPANKKQQRILQNDNVTPKKTYDAESILIHLKEPLQMAYTI